MRWVRAKDGALFGVCKGIARNLDISVGLVRLLWIISAVFLGTGVLLYLMLAVALPREDKVVESLDPWILGVCSRIALRSNLDVGVVRFFAIVLSFLSLGATLVGYVVLHFVLDEKSKSQSSDNKPSTPPATT